MSENAASKQTDERVLRLTAMLESANRELETFSYAVSHDLRAPLRAVDGYSRILCEDYADKLDDDGRRMLGVIRTETQRMNRLIDGMLAFSRLGRQELIPEVIDMHAMAGEVFAELASKEDQSRHIHLTLNPLPAATGSRAMIRQVWEHLLSNAIKFTCGRDIAEIEIGSATGADGTIEYHVRDNGAGFDIQHAGDKLFGMFQRFHGETEFPGTGIDLALARRILNRHGGSIRAESVQNQGATFHFSLPQPTS